MPQINISRHNHGECNVQSEYGEKVVKAIMKSLLITIVDDRLPYRYLTLRETQAFYPIDNSEPFYNEMVKDGFIDIDTFAPNVRITIDEAIIMAEMFTFAVDNYGRTWAEEVSNGN